jgi:Helitron helicase-like domain at N-terminus
MTCNGNWPEIKKHLKGQAYSDRPDLCDRVFKMKLSELLSELRSGSLFGEVDYYMYVIEFQKRGSPLAHIVLKFIGVGLSSVVKLKSGSGQLYLTIVCLNCVLKYCLT